MRNASPALAVAVALGLASGLALPAPAQTLSSKGPVLDELVPRLLKDGDVPGLAVAFVEDGRVSWNGVYGLREAAARDELTPRPPGGAGGGAPPPNAPATGARVDADTVFEAASLTKPVFAYLVLKLVDAGKLDLETPLPKLLPGDYVDDPRLVAVTARRALSHTAGFPNWRPPGQPLAIHFPPGERFSYSGEGFDYLQKVVERVTGETLDALSRRLVLEPLGMTSSRFVWEERFSALKATGHDAAGNPLPPRRPWDADAAATLHTTARDYARFLAAALAGTGLSPRSFAEMRRAQIHVDEGCSNCVARPPTGRLSKEVAWGLGWGLEETDQGLALWHWGDNPTGFHAFVMGYPRERRGVVVFTNGLGGHGIISDVVKAVFPGRHPAFTWLGYERWDSPSRGLLREILATPERAIAAYRERKQADPGAALTESQINRVGYWLLARQRPKEAIAVFEMNAADFPESWNVFDSLGEALAGDGQKERAIASYQRSLALNPASTSGADALKKLNAAK